MGFVAAFDKEIFYNPATRYAILQLKTADMMIPQEARSPYKYSDHLIRFSAVSYVLPQNDTVKMDLDGAWVNGKHGVRFEVAQWKEILPSTVQGIRAYLASGLWERHTRRLVLPVGGGLLQRPQRQGRP